MNTSNVRLCPREGCKDGVVDMALKPPQCKKCRNAFCRNCMMLSHPGSCDDNLLEVLKGFKKCPRCGIMIQKISGCNEVRCRCRHQFCYACLRSWKPNHYNCVDPEENERSAIIHPVPPENPRDH